MNVWVGMNIPEHTWLDVGAVADVPVRGARVIKSAFGCVAVFRTAEDEVFALEDRCRTKAARCPRASCTDSPSRARCTTG